MDEDERKIGMLIAAFDEERQHLKLATVALNQVGAQLKQEARDAARGAAAEALRSLQPQIHKAGQALIELQRFSLGRAALQHAVVALMAIAVTLTVVWWYVPPLAEITARRAERDQLEASIDDLSKRGARISLSTCGDRKRLCVAIDEAAGRFGDPKRAEAYRIAKGY
jgi:hypothetical protein